MRQRSSPPAIRHANSIPSLIGKKRARTTTINFSTTFLFAGCCLFCTNVGFAFFFLAGSAEKLGSDNVTNGPSTSLRMRNNASSKLQVQSNLRGATALPKPTYPPHKHAIPNVLIFTYAFDLIHKEFEFVNFNASQLTPEQAELVVLKDNVHNIIALHPTAQVRFLTDDDCVQSIRNMFANNLTVANELVQYFRGEPTGMFKADLCRGAALYETGGLYLDVDLGVRMNLFTALREPTEFATVEVHRQSKHPGAFFQAFTATTPHHPVIYRYVELFLLYYRSHQPIDGPLGVMFLKRAFDDVDPPTAGVEIWKEALYNPDLQHTLLRDVPPPVWGYRRACKFIVLTAPKVPVVVPLYSRIAGSRMCPKRTSASNDTDW